MFKKLKRRGFDVLALHHAEAILSGDMPEAEEEIDSVIGRAQIPVEELIRGGGGEHDNTQRMRNALAELGWVKHTFTITKSVDGVEKESITHEIDHVKAFPKGTLALEIEWNNKDPFFDRDLENYKRLHADGVISVGMIVTRGASLHEGLREIVEEFANRNGIRAIDDLSAYYNPTARQRQLIEGAAASAGDFAKGWARVFVSDKFGEATTHWRKLQDRVLRGVGNPCPLILIGIPRAAVTF